MQPTHSPHLTKLLRQELPATGTALNPHDRWLYNCFIYLDILCKAIPRTTAIASSWALFIAVPTESLSQWNRERVPSMVSSSILAPPKSIWFSKSSSSFSTHLLYACTGTKCCVQHLFQGVFCVWHLMWTLAVERQPFAWLPNESFSESLSSEPEALVAANKFESFFSG